MAIDCRKYVRITSWLGAFFGVDDNGSPATPTDPGGEDTSMYLSDNGEFLTDNGEYLTGNTA